MPKDENQEAENIIDGAEMVEKSAPKQEAGKTKKSAQKSNKTLIIVLVVACVFAGSAIYAAVSDIIVRNRLNNEDGSSSVTVIGQPYQYQNQMVTRHIFVQSTSTSDDTSETVVSGVVTSVNGKTFVVGGGGESTTVKMTDSTVYNTVGKTVAVNDTVSVVGTLVDKVVTATEVRILNN
jgi:hypothetical protein